MEEEYVSNLFRKKKKQKTENKWKVVSYNRFKREFMIAYFLRVDRSFNTYYYCQNRVDVILESKNFMVAGTMCEPVVVGYMWSKITAIFICF